MRGIYLITPENWPLQRLAALAVAAAETGISALQLRNKRGCTRELLQQAQVLKAILDPAGVPLFINDRLDVALAAGAAGVHLGQSDLPYPEARRLAGPELLIGLSIENQQQLAPTADWDLAYIGVGPVFATPSKADAALPLGLDALAVIVQASQHPVVAIGGLGLSNLSAVLATGAVGAAVLSAVSEAPEPAVALSTLKDLYERSTGIL